MSYEGLDNDEEFKMFHVVDSDIDNVSIVTDSEAFIDIKNSKENVFDEDIDDNIKAPLQMTVKEKVVSATKKLQASYNDDANKFIKQATKKCHKKFELPA